MKNYKGINEKFVGNNYGFLETLAQIGIMCGEMGYYPSQDSREQSSSIIDHAQKFCNIHTNTDWDKTDWLITLTNYVSKFYVEWANEEVLSGEYSWDKDMVANVQKWVNNITHNLKN